MTKRFSVSFKSFRGFIIEIEKFLKQQCLSKQKYLTYKINVKSLVFKKILFISLKSVLYEKALNNRACTFLFWLLRLFDS